MSSFPWDPQYSKDYDALKQKAEADFASGVITKDAMDETIANLENERAREKMKKSYMGSLGRIIEPLVMPLGFDWKIGVGLFGGFIAKEIVVGTLGTLYAVGEADEESVPLRERIQADTWPDGRKIFTPLTAFALMVFTLLYIPCVASIAVIYKETNSWKWPLFVAGYATALAWAVSFMVYQGGKLIGLE